MSETLTIGRAARLAKVNTQTLHYYERRGLLRPESRLESGYRLYGDESIRKIRFIKNAQGLGFSLDEIARLLRLRVGRTVQCLKVRRQAQMKLNLVRQKILQLNVLEKTLRRLIKTCESKGTTDSCPILEAVADATPLGKTRNRYIKQG